MVAPTRIRRSILDRLIADRHEGTDGLVMTYDVTQLRDAVARDLESLLNSRSAMDFEEMHGCPNAQKSIVCFGVRDFVGRVLTNSEEQRYIARSLSHAIETHEPRLRHVRVEFDSRPGSTNALSFTIRAMLVVHPARESVSFDAVLQPAMSRFAVMKARFA